MKNLNSTTERNLNVKYTEKHSNVDIKTQRVIVTNHALQRFAQYTKISSKQAVLKLVAVSNLISQNQVNEYFKFTDNKENMIRHSPTSKLFFIMKFDGPDLILKTCVRERA